MAKLPTNQKGTIERGAGGDFLVPSGGIPQAPAVKEEKTPSAVKTSTPTTPSIDAVLADIGTQLEQAKIKALDIQKKAQELSSKTKTDTGAFVSDSESVRNEEKDVTQTVADLTPTTTIGDDGKVQTTASSATLDLIDKRTAELEARRKSEIEDIKSQFAEAKVGLEREQATEKGATAVGLARMGGFLGPSGSQTGVLLNLAQTHRSEISTLESKKAQAISQANAAVNDKQFDLARLQVQEIKSIEEDINTRQEDFIKSQEEITKQGLVFEGITNIGSDDPLELFQAINFDGTNFNPRVTFDDIANVTTKIKSTPSPASAAVKEYIEAVQFGLVPPETSFEEYLDVKNPARKLDLLKKGLDIQKVQKELSQASTQMSPDQMSMALRLTNALKSQPAYVDMLDIETGMRGVTVGLSQENGFGDIAAINAFQRMVDPGATVRSEDVVLLQTASAMIHKVLSDFPIERLTKGSKLPDPVRAQMLKVATELYETRAGNYNDTVGQQFKNLSGGSNIPFEYIGVDFPEKAEGFGVQIATTPKEKTEALDKILEQEDIDVVESLNLEDEVEQGFGDEFLSIFGLQTK